MGFLRGFTSGLPWLLAGLGAWMIAAGLALWWGLSVLQFFVLLCLCVLYRELNEIGRVRWARRRVTLTDGRAA